jgi:peptidoglycan/LPS O-acetylase OafA/YrhL
MATSKGFSSRRLAWIEGIRIFAAVVLLLYHAQLLITNYAFTPNPTGLISNLHVMQAASDRLTQNSLTSILTLPIWFGFQFVDIFILISGFVLVLSLKGNSLNLGQFYKHRFRRILIPFWTVSLLSYPILWALGTATKTYIPDAWHTFAGLTFPLLFQFDGELLLKTSGPWWFMPLILSFTLIFPFLWHLLQRWGSRNLLIVSLILTIAYRVLAVYKFGGHPTYVALSTSADWLPFLTCLAKLSTFVVGMAIAHAYCQGRGLIFWSTRHIMTAGISLYVVGFVCQFSRLGWIFADLLLPIGLFLCCMLLFRWIAAIRSLQAPLVWLGSHSYSYFLIHNFVVDRTINLVIHDRLPLYYTLLPFMVVGTLLLAVIADYATSLFQRLFMALIKDIDFVLTTTPTVRVRHWYPKVGDRVRYSGEPSWTILKVEKLLDDKEIHYLCQISDGHKTLWLSEHDLEPDRSGISVELNGHSGANPTSS